MDILFLATWFPVPPDNGSKLRVHYLLRALAQQHRLTLLSFAFDTAQPDAPGKLQSFCQDIHVVRIDPFKFNQTGTLQTFISPRPTASRPVPAMQRMMNSILRTHSFDVIIASTAMTAPYALQAPSKSIRVLEEHNSMTRWAQDRHQNARTLLQRMRSWASLQKIRRHESLLFRQFDLITMVSEQDRAAAAALLKRGGSRIQVVPNGVDCDLNRPEHHTPKPNTLVFNGALTYYPNYEAIQWFLSHIYPYIKARQPDITLTITGSLRGVNLDRLPLDNQVNLTGFVDDVRIPVMQASVCIVPIRQGSGTRLKILEAMALGTPIVSTTKGAEGLDVVDGKHLLLADDPITFAARTVELLSNPGLRQRLVVNARRLVTTHYDWKQIGQRFVRLVEKTALHPRGNA